MSIKHCIGCGKSFDFCKCESLLGEEQNDVERRELAEGMDRLKAEIRKLEKDQLTSILERLRDDILKDFETLDIDDAAGLVAKMRIELTIKELKNRYEIHK